MKIAKTIFVSVSLLIIGLWGLAWTPAFELLPQVVKQFMFVFGGVLTFIVPLLVIALFILWLSGNRQSKNMEVN
jgi:hypothetical protein